MSYQLAVDPYVIARDVLLQAAEDECAPKLLAISNSRAENPKATQQFEKMGGGAPTQAGVGTIWDRANARCRPWEVEADAETCKYSKS